jgi:hypothetical protein
MKRRGVPHLGVSSGKAYLRGDVRDSLSAITVESESCGHKNVFHAIRACILYEYGWKNGSCACRQHEYVKRIPVCTCILHKYVKRNAVRTRVLHKYVNRNTRCRRNQDKYKPKQARRACNQDKYKLKQARRTRNQDKYGRREPESGQCRRLSFLIESVPICVICGEPKHREEGETRRHVPSSPQPSP